ncbi:MAG: hypothetical protein MSH41_04515 [Bacteroidales bacterium]|nr:hypothetical protein [Bacteroidales bacterium]
MKSVASVVAAVLDALENRRYETARDYFTADGWLWLNQSIKVYKTILIHAFEYVNITYILICVNFFVNKFFYISNIFCIFE